jgi:F420-non-reducing hydrogenase small subunit
VPALSNLSTREQHLEALYGTAPAGGGEIARPHEEVEVPEGLLRLPRFHERVRCLADVVEVDFTIPGCPPESSQLGKALDALTAETPLPPRGSVLGAGESSVCEECTRSREEKHLTTLRRVWEFDPSREQCLLDQGLPCVGLATRNGCGALCPAVNMPCSGCYGPPEGVYHQAARFLGAVASVLDVSAFEDSRNVLEITTKVDRTLDSLPDPAGTAGKYSLAGRRAKPRLPQGGQP